MKGVGANHATLGKGGYDNVISVSCLSRLVDEIKALSCAFAKEL